MMQSIGFGFDRSRQRGSALVEALVVIPCFIVLFGGMLFIHHVIRAQQRANRDAKNEAWSLAMAGCSGGGNGAPQPEFASTMAGAPGSAASLQNSSGNSVATATGSVSVSALGMNGPAPADGTPGGFAFSQTVTAKNTVFCNNRTESGSVVGVAQWLGWIGP